MDEGGRQLGALVIAIVVIVALIAIARAVFSENGILKTKITEELNKVSSTTTSSIVYYPNYDFEI